VNVLKDAGMVEIARLEGRPAAARGNITNRIHVCSLTTSLRDSDQTLSAAQDHTTEELRTLLTSLYEAHGDDIEAVAEELKPV